MTLRMYLHKPKVVMVAQVDLGGNTAVYPQDHIAFKNVTVGAYTALRAGMTILLGTAPGKDDLGRIRYMYMNSLYPTNGMVVSRFSQGIGDGEGTLIENTYITVWEEYRLWAKVPRMQGGVVYKDAQWWASQNAANPPPVANAGIGIAGTIDGTGKITVRFSMGNSFQWSLSAGVVGGYTAQITRWLWEVPTGTIINGGNVTTSQSIEVTFSPGFHYAYLTVWGANYPGGEENKHTTSVPVFVRDPANDVSTVDFHITNHNQNLAGVEITAEFFNAIPRTEYPDGGMMMMWDDAMPYSYDNREHMQFVGWHYRDAVNITTDETATLHSTSLTFLNAGRKLGTLPGFSMVLGSDPAESNNWSLAAIPSMFYYFWFILFWHSTALEVVDLRIESDILLHYEFVILGSDRSNLYEQVNSIAQKIAPDHYLTCHKTGVLQVVADPLIMTQAERDTYKYIDDAYDDADWTDISFAYQRVPKVNQIRTMSMISGKTFNVVNGKKELPIIACVAPGEANGQGEQYIEVNERIAKSQTGLNAAEGNRYARMNARYERFNITLPYEKINSIYDLSHMQWVTLTITGNNNSERELPVRFTAQKGLVWEMTHMYEYSPEGVTHMVTVQWEMETIGKPAQTTVLWPNVPDPTMLVRGEEDA